MGDRIFAEGILGLSLGGVLHDLKIAGFRSCGVMSRCDVVVRATSFEHRGQLGNLKFIRL